MVPQFKSLVIHLGFNPCFNKPLVNVTQFWLHLLFDTLELTNDSTCVCTLGKSINTWLLSTWCGVDEHIEHLGSFNSVALCTLPHASHWSPLAWS